MWAGIEVTMLDWPAFLLCVQLLHLGVSPAVCSVSSRSAEEFRFHLPSFYPGSAPGILVGDGALLVADKHGYAGKEEFYA